MRADAPHESSGQAIDQARCHRVEDHRHPEDARENHEGPGAVRQRGNRLCDLRGGEAQPPRHQIPGIRAAVPPELRSLHSRRIDPADGNALRLQLPAQRLCQSTQAKFRRIVHRRRGHTDQSGNRRDIDDHATPAAQHHRGHGPGQQNWGDQIEGYLGVDIVRLERVNPVVPAHPGIVDQHVDLPVARDRGLDDPHRFVRVRQIRGNGQALRQRGGQLPQALFPARHQHDPVTARPECPGCRLTDSTACAGDDDPHYLLMIS